MYNTIQYNNIQYTIYNIYIQVYNINMLFSIDHGKASNVFLSWEPFPKIT